MRGRQRNQWTRMYVCLWVFQVVLVQLEGVMCLIRSSPVKFSLSNRWIHLAVSWYGMLLKRMATHKMYCLIMRTVYIDWLKSKQKDANGWIPSTDNMLHSTNDTSPIELAPIIMNTTRVMPSSTTTSAVLPASSTSVPLPITATATTTIESIVAPSVDCVVENVTSSTMWTSTIESNSTQSERYFHTNKHEHVHS